MSGLCFISAGTERRNALPGTVKQIVPIHTHQRRPRHAYESEALGKLPSNPRMTPIAAQAVRGRDFMAEPLWSMTLTGLNNEHSLTGETVLTSGHGFSDGCGICMAGWTESAIHRYESLSQARTLMNRDLGAEAGCRKVRSRHETTPLEADVPWKEDNR